MPVLAICVVFGACGCDRLYGILHKPGGEERAILGNVVFNEYNPRVEAIQRYLVLLGCYAGRPDGKFGAGTRAAVARFQKDEGLEVTRFVDQATDGRLQYYVHSQFVNNGVLDIKAVQRRLAQLGYAPGKPDGQMGAQTRAALRRFQRVQGLADDGLMGLETLRALIATAVPGAPEKAEH